MVKDITSAAPAPRCGPFPSLIELNGQALSLKELQNANLYDVDYLSPVLVERPLMQQSVKQFVLSSSYPEINFVKTKAWKK